MHHSISTLHYRLLAGPVCLEPLRILETRETWWHGWQVTLSVLGASHAVCLRRSDLCLTELLACAAPEGALHTLAQRAGDTPGSLCISAGGLMCQVWLETFALAEGERLHNVFSPERQMTVAYPLLQPGKKRAIPVTRLGWCVQESALTIETVHTYPEEGRGVRSISVWTPEGAER